MELTKYEAFVYHNRPRLTGLAALIVVVFATPTMESLLCGAFIVLLGEFGRIWALGYIDKDAELATTGPYAFTRNPLYVFNTTMFVGFCIIGNSFIPSIVAAVIFVWIYIVVIDIEAKRMVHLFGESYETWSNHVPLFLPRLTPWKDRAQKAYSFALMLGHKEPKHWFGVIVGISIFYAIFYFQNK